MVLGVGEQASPPAGSAQPAANSFTPLCWGWGSVVIQENMQKERMYRTLLCFSCPTECASGPFGAAILALSPGRAGRGHLCQGGGLEAWAEWQQPWAAWASSLARQECRARLPPKKGIELRQILVLTILLVKHMHGIL